MLNHHFQHDIIRKYIILFGTLFNNIIIRRTDSSNNSTHIIKVPISYAPKEKMLARFEGDPEINREASVILPRMSYEMEGPIYDGDRQLNKIGQVWKKNEDDANKLLHQYTPVAYNFPFKLYIYAKHATDCTRIVEQIYPFFRPAFTPTVELIPSMEDSRDIAIILQNTEIEDNYNDRQFKERRAIVWTLHFMLKGFLYGPVTNKPIIKFANTRFICASSNSSVTMQDLIDNYIPLELIHSQPGLDANGNPTANVSNSIDYNLIKIDDDWGYAITFNGHLVTED